MECPVGERARGETYRPGDIVPTTGIYKIYHRQHRLMHEAALIEETAFPRCRKCKGAVRFVLARSVETKLVLPFRPTELLEAWEGPLRRRAKAG